MRTLCNKGKIVVSWIRRLFFHGLTTSPRGKHLKITPPFPSVVCLIGLIIRYRLCFWQIPGDLLVVAHNEAALHTRGSVRTKRPIVTRLAGSPVISPFPLLLALVRGYKPKKKERKARGRAGLILHFPDTESLIIIACITDCVVCTSLPGGGGCSAAIHITLSAVSRGSPTLGAERHADKDDRGFCFFSRHCLKRWTWPKQTWVAKSRCSPWISMGFFSACLTLRLPLWISFLNLFSRAAKGPLHEGLR